MAGSERVIVVGGGGFGRELMCWVEDCAAAGRLPQLAGFIDDRSDELPGYAPRLGAVMDFEPQPGDLLALAIAKPATKRKVTGLLKDRGAQFTAVIHPSTTVVRTATIGEGLILCPQAMLMPDSRTDRFVTILNFSGVGHDSVVGEFTTFSSLCDVTGNVTVGADVFVGAGARLLPGIKVGDGALIGAGATVVRSVKPGNTVYSAPPKTLKGAGGADKVRDSEAEGA
jgi:sugar O-acyltransferase (sialic acid O-acetyltransferase NeuD family)